MSQINHPGHRSDTSSLTFRPSITFSYLADWEKDLTPAESGLSTLTEALGKWDSLRGGKTRNTELVWIPKPITNLADMRRKLAVALKVQLGRSEELGAESFIENEVAEELVRSGAFTRPGTATDELMEEYEEETEANQPHLSSFRMQNRLFRFLGWTTRVPGKPNEYRVTHRGKQISQFTGNFPGKIGTLSERDLVLKSLVNWGVFSVNDNVDQWDTRFKQRIIVNVLRVAAEYGYITNNELVVTAFALKDERNPQEIDLMMDRLRRLHDGRLSIYDAFTEVGVDPDVNSAVTGAYDGPKVVTSLCRQVNLFEPETSQLKEAPFGDLRDLYAKMHQKKGKVSKPRVVNLITPLGEQILEQELEKATVWFDELG